MFELKVFTFQTCLGPRPLERQQGLFLWCTLWKKLWVTVNLTIFIVEYKSRIKYEHRLGFPFTYTNTRRIIWRTLRRGTVLIPLLVVIFNHQLLRCFFFFVFFPLRPSLVLNAQNAHHRDHPSITAQSAACTGWRQADLTPNFTKYSSDLQWQKLQLNKTMEHFEWSRFNLDGYVCLYSTWT